MRTWIVREEHPVGDPGWIIIHDTFDTEAAAQEYVSQMHSILGPCPDHNYEIVEIEVIKRTAC